MKFLSKLSKETLICSELQVKDYKEILKCSYGASPDKILFIETVSEVFANLTKKPPEYFKKLSLVDFFGLLLDVRVSSLGDSCNVSINVNGTKMGLELRLDYIKQEIEKTFNELSRKLEFDNLSIVFECPSVERSIEARTEEYVPFIKGCYLKQNDLVRYFEITTNQQAAEFVERLSPKVTSALLQHTKLFYDIFAKANFLSRYRISNQVLNFIPSLDSILWYTTIIFSESLETFYSNLFYLAHIGNIGAEYIENSVVGEYNFFVSQLREVLASKKSSEDSNTLENDVDF